MIFFLYLYRPLSFASIYQFFKDLSSIMGGLGGKSELGPLRVSKITGEAICIRSSDSTRVRERGSQQNTINQICIVQIGLPLFPA